MPGTCARRCSWRSQGSLPSSPLLLIALRSPGRAARVLAPLALSVVTVAALLSGLGYQLGILHIVGMLLIVAVGSNYALFFDRNSADPQHGSQALTLASLLVANVATVLAFGVLAFSRVPVLADLGETVAPGALWHWCSPRSCRHAQPAGPGVIEPAMSIVLSLLVRATPRRSDRDADTGATQALRTSSRPALPGGAHPLPGDRPGVCAGRGAPPRRRSLPAQVWELAGPRTAATRRMARGHLARRLPRTVRRTVQPTGTRGPVPAGTLPGQSHRHWRGRPRGARPLGTGAAGGR